MRGSAHRVTHKETQRKFRERAFQAIRLPINLAIYWCFCLCYLPTATPRPEKQQEDVGDVNAYNPSIRLPFTLVETLIE